MSNRFFNDLTPTETEAYVNVYDSVYDSGYIPNCSWEMRQDIRERGQIENAWYATEAEAQEELERLQEGAECEADRSLPPVAQVVEYQDYVCYIEVDGHVYSSSEIDCVIDKLEGDAVWTKEIEEKIKEFEVSIFRIRWN
jgi:hypothetical protein